MKSNRLFADLLYIYFLESNFMVKQLNDWAPSLRKVSFESSKCQNVLRVTAGFLLLLLMLLVSGCGGNSGDKDNNVDDTENGTGKVERVIVTHSNNLKHSRNDIKQSEITIIPAIVSIPIGGSQQYMATAIYADGSSRDVTTTSIWSSSSTSTSTINAATGLATGIAAGSAILTAKFEGVSGTATLKVTSATLNSLVITPNTAFVPIGINQNFLAIGEFNDGSTFDMSNIVTWSSSSNAIATISQVGTAKGISLGVATITATSGAKLATATITIQGTALVSISVTPENVISLPKGYNQSLQAKGTFSDGTTIDISNSVVWSTNLPKIAIVNSIGIVTGVSYGIATITATYGDKSDTTTMTVSPATLVSIFVRSTESSIPRGFAQNFYAIGGFSDGSSFDISDTVAWSSSDTDIATVVSPGVVTNMSAGSAVITATYEGIKNSSTLVVSDEILNSIAVTPFTATIAVGATQAYVVTGVFSDGTSRVINGVTNWSTNNSAVATINSSGLASAVKAGTVKVIAQADNKIGTATLIVSGATLGSIAVSPVSVSIPSGLTQTFVAIGSYSDGTSTNISGSVTWSSSSTAIATITSPGVATGVSVGATTIRATLGSQFGSASMTVTSASLSSIAVTPSATTIPLGSTQALVATGTYSDGTIVDISSTVTWSSGNNAVVTVLPTGVATGVAVGSAVITATSGIKTGTTTVTTTPATLSSIAVTPLTASIPSSLTQAFVATGTYSDGTSLVITNSVTWSSNTTAVATVLPTGIANGLTTGTAIITATSGLKTGSATLTVNSVLLVSLAVTPLAPSIAFGNTQAFTANGTFSDATIVDMTNIVTWTSSNLPIATVLSTGIASGLSAGASTITATSGLITSSATLTVTTATLMSIAVTPALPTIANGGTQAFVATGTYSDASTLNITNSVIWSSNNLPVATILATGVASGPSAGTARITATSGLITSFATLTVNAALGPAVVNLGTAGNFVILTKTGITNAVAATLLITGDIGSSPITGAAMNTIPCAKVVGFVYEVDAAYTGGACGKSTAADKTTVDNAVLDMGIAFADAKGRTLPDQTELGAGNISGMTLVPGLYKWGTGVLITNAGVTLSGGPNDIWIFQVAVDLTVNSGAIITLTGGALPKNIFWQVDGQVTLGTTSDFKGIILSQTLISVDTTAVVNGRLLAQTEVTLQGNAITQPAP